MKSEPLIDYPILTEELELAEGLPLQKRLRGCGSRGALTIRTREFTVWSGVLDPPWVELAAGRPAPAADRPDPDQLQPARDAICKRAREEMHTVADETETAITQAAGALPDRS